VIRKLFLDHPEQVGETYFEHLFVASRVGLTMVVCGIACALHALIPAIFPTTGSDAVRRLYDQMVKKRAARRDAYFDARVLDWVI
jgi:hypothetical protein